MSQIDVHSTNENACYIMKRSEIKRYQGCQRTY